MADRPSLLLVDSHSLIHQAYHAVGPLTTRDGTPTGAVFGFAQMLLRLLEDLRPTALALAFDTPEPTFRHLQYPDYKAHRDPLDAALIQQFPLVEELAAAFRWAAVRLPGFEADDLIATLATQAADEWEVYIVTADRDLCQLVGEHVTLLAGQSSRTGETQVFDEPAVVERFGVRPALVPDYKGLVGDPSDNLPGVKGIGDKTAKDLLSQFGDLEGVLAAADTLKGKRREVLLEQADLARLFRELATVRRDAPVNVRLDDLRRREADDDAVVKLLTRLELHQLMRRLNVRVTGAPQAVDYRSVADDATADEAARAVAEAQVVGLAWRDDWAGVALSPGPGRAFFFPLTSRGGAQLALFGDEGEAVAERRRLEIALAPLRAGRIGYVVHDVQRLYRNLGALDPGLAALRGDTHLAAWLLDPERPEHDLANLAQRHIGTPVPEPPEGHADAGAFRCCRTADLALRLEPRLREDLEAAHLSTVYQAMELPLAPILARMMAVGVVVDRPRTAALDRELTDAIAERRAAFTELAGADVNIDSPKQLGDYLYTRLGLPAGRKTKTGHSTDAATLQEIRELHPAIDVILEYRELAKLRSTYTDVLLTLSDPDSGRIHTTLNQTGTATGRLSSSQPNLQNIPVRGGWGERVRDLFRAPAGWRLLAADYSQIELRVLAHVSGDPRLIEAFRRGEDIHATAAHAIFGVAPDQVTSEQRRMAKVLNFGVAYGIQAHGLSHRLEISRPEAQALIDAYFARFPLVKRYAEDTIARARQTGYVQTIFGRRRTLPNLTAGNAPLRQGAERAAINMPIQGAAADILKRAMLDLDTRLREGAYQGRMILQVHDELLVECPPEEETALVRLLQDCMVRAAELDVPLEVKVKVGERWGSLVAVG